MKKCIILLVLISCSISQVHAQDSVTAVRYEKGTYEYYNWKRKGNLTAAIVLYGVGATCLTISLFNALDDIGTILQPNHPKSSGPDAAFIIGSTCVAASIPFIVGYFRNKARMKAVIRQQQVSLATPPVSVGQIGVGLQLRL